MSKDCGQIEALVQQYLDRELSDAGQQRMTRHLATCRRCRVEYGPLLETIRDVEQVAAPTLPAGLLERVLGNIVLEPSRSTPGMLGPSLQRPRTILPFHGPTLQDETDAWFCGSAALPRQPQFSWRRSPGCR